MFLQARLCGEHRMIGSVCHFERSLAVHASSNLFVSGGQRRFHISGRFWQSMSQLITIPGTLYIPFLFLFLLASLDG